MDYSEGKFCIYKEDYVNDQRFGFLWNYIDRGLYKQPNEGWIIDIKVKRDLSYYTSYGFDETILIEKVPSKYSRKSSYNGRELIYNAYNVQLTAIQIDNDNKINLVWKYGCKHDG